MAKGNMILGQLRGAVGSIVFSRSNGQQVVRSKAETIKNPKTLKQTIQRILLNTAAQAYSTCQVIADHSFEGKKSGQECMNTFMSKNLEYLRARVAEIVDGGGDMSDIFNFAPVGMSGIFPGAWILSKGTLPKVNVTLVPFTTIGSSKMKLAAPANTYADIIARYGLRRGDQLTFVTLEAPIESENVYFNYARVILDPRNVDGTAADLSSAFIDDGHINLPNGKNEGNFGTLLFSTDHFEISLTSGDVICAAVIVSREADGTWKRSDSQFIVQEAILQDYNAYSLAAAIAASKGVNIDVENALYLNNAGTGGQQSTNSGGSEPAPSPSEPTFSTSVKFTGNGASATQSVAGGSTTVTAPITAMEVTGSNLTEGILKVGTANDVSQAANMTVNGAGTKATWSGSAAAGTTLYVFKNGTLWFTASAVAPEGGGDGDAN